MTLRVVVGAVQSAEMGVWTAKLTPGGVRRLGEVMSSHGTRSVIGIEEPEFDAAAESLSMRPDKTVVLNVGTLNDAVLIDLGRLDLGESPLSAVPERDVAEPAPTRKGDHAFLDECKHH